jgi:ribose 5-phosphate isomerase B
MMYMKIAVGSDHGGFELKQAMTLHLRETGVEFEDFGVFCDASVDYPDIAVQVAEAVARGEYDRGLLFCGTGVGISIAANKVAGIRAANCHDVFSAQMSREHNNANVLAMGGRVIGTGLAAMIIDVWLSTEFVGGRHERRIGKIAAYEQGRPL